MTALSDIANIDLANVNLFAVLAALVCGVIGVVFVKLKRREYPRANRALNLATYVQLVAAAFAAVWILAEVVFEIASPPMQVLALTVFVVMFRYVTYLAWDPILEEVGAYWMNIALVPAIDLFLLVLYFFNQSTTILSSVEYVGPVFTAIRVPNESVVSVVILAYLFAEYILTASSAIALYADSGNPDRVRALCGPGTKKMTPACMNELHESVTTYSLFMKIYALVLYTAYFFYNHYAAASSSAH